MFAKSLNNTSETGKVSICVKHDVVWADNKIRSVNWPMYVICTSSAAV